MKKLRPIIIRVACSPEEVLRLKHKADELGLGMAGYLRACALATMLVTPREEGVVPRVGMRVEDRSWVRASPRRGTVVSVEEPRSSVRVWVDWDGEHEPWRSPRTVIAVRSLHRDPNKKKGFLVLDDVTSPSVPST